MTKISIHLLLQLLLLSITKKKIQAKAPKWNEVVSLSSYTFSSYVQDFNKPYKQVNSTATTDGNNNNTESSIHYTKEWKHRQRIFQDNLNKIVKHNNNNKENNSYKMGINQFTDLTNDEIKTGLIRGAPQIDASVSSSGSGTRMEEALPFELSDVSDLPDEIDWRIEGVVTPVKDQGHCGSCWAFATIAVLESHIALQTGYLFTFSPQELVSCVPNPEHCGGSGGCDGSTEGIAFDFIAKHGGIVLEDYMGYDSGRTGSDGVCSIHNSSSPDPLDIVGGIAGIQNYTVLPANNYSVLMNAVAKYGPVTVSVAAGTWAGYETGVLRYEDTMNNTNKYTINHAVTLVGYGTDLQTGLDFWLVRNSWSPLWGENGYIRLERVDPETLPSPKMHCGIDNQTDAGSACIDGNGTVTPREMEVCGTCAILSESTIPIGGYLMRDHTYIDALIYAQIS